MSAPKSETELNTDSEEKGTIIGKTYLEEK